MLAKQCFDVSVNQNRHVSLDARRFLQFGAFGIIDFMHQLDRHIGFSRQTLDFGIRIRGTVEGLVAPQWGSIFHSIDFIEKSISPLFCLSNLPFEG